MVNKENSDRDTDSSTDNSIETGSNSSTDNSVADNPYPVTLKRRESVHTVLKIQYHEKLLFLSL